MHKIIVTGGAGFIGSAVIQRLNQEGLDDLLIVDNLGSSEKWKNLAGLRFTDYLHKDVFIKMAMADALAWEPWAVVHLGACSSTTMNDVDYLMENNYRFSRILAEWATKRSIRFIYASSAATYGRGENGFSDSIDIRSLRPLNPYGYSKHLFDLYALRSGLYRHMAGLKFFNVFGPNEYHKGDMTSVVFKAFQQIRATGQVELFKSHRADYTDGEQKRDFVYVKDCAEIVWQLIGRRDISGLFNLGTGKARSFNDLVKAVFSSLGVSPSIHYIDMPEHLRSAYQYYTQADMHRLADAGCPLNFRPLDAAVRDYVANHLMSPQPYLSINHAASESQIIAERPLW